MVANRSNVAQPTFSDELFNLSHNEQRLLKINLEHFAYANLTDSQSFPICQSFSLLRAQTLRGDHPPQREVHKSSPSVDRRVRPSSNFSSSEDLIICDVVSMKVEIWAVVSIHHALPVGAYNPNIVLRDNS